MTGNAGQAELTPVPLRSRHGHLDGVSAFPWNARDCRSLDHRERHRSRRSRSSRQARRSRNGRWRPAFTVAQVSRADPPARLPLSDTGRAAIHGRLPRGCCFDADPHPDGGPIQALRPLATRGLPCKWRAGGVPVSAEQVSPREPFESPPGLKAGEATRQSMTRARRSSEAEPLAVASWPGRSRSPLAAAGLQPTEASTAPV